MNVTQEAARYDSAYSKGDTSVPNVAERLGVCPPTAYGGSLQNQGCDSWNLGYFFWIGKVEANEFFRRRQGQTSLDRILRDIDGKLCNKFVVEYVVIDCVPDRATDDANGQRQRYTSGDEFIRTVSQLVPTI